MSMVVQRIRSDFTRLAPLKESDSLEEPGPARGTPAACEVAGRPETLSVSVRSLTPAGGENTVNTLLS